jgi:hypothetical protein
VSEPVVAPSKCECFASMDQTISQLSPKGALMTPMNKPVTDRAWGIHVRVLVAINILPQAGAFGDALASSIGRPRSARAPPPTAILFGKDPVGRAHSIRPHERLRGGEHPLSSIPHSSEIDLPHTYIYPAAHQNA